MACDQFFESCNRKLYVHLKLKSLKNLDEMAREANLFAEAWGHISSWAAKGKSENKDSKGYNRVEPSKWGNKPEIKCRISEKPHLTYKCWNNLDKKVLSTADIVSDGWRLVTASSAETRSMQFKGDNVFNRSRGNNWGGGFGRGNNRDHGRGHGRGVGNKFDNATGGGHQLNFCRVKGHKGSSDGIETIYQTKVDSSLNSDVNDMEGVCYSLRYHWWPDSCNSKGYWMYWGFHLFVCLCWGFMAQSTQWGHVKRVKFI